MWMHREDEICLNWMLIDIIWLFSNAGYYSETDRTGAIQKTIPSIQRPPPNYMIY